MIVFQSHTILLAFMPFKVIKIAVGLDQRDVSLKILLELLDHLSCFGDAPVFKHVVQKVKDERC